MYEYIVILRLNEKAKTEIGIKRETNNVMKNAGFSSIIILCVLFFMCGCVQIIINPPQIPGSTLSSAPPVTAQPASDDAPVPVVTAAPKKETPVAAGTKNQQFIIPVGDVTRTGHRTFTFNYAPESGGSHEYTFRVPVNMSVYYGARQMNILLPENSRNPEEVRRYISTFESDPAMEELYTSVLTQLRNARYRNGGYLSDDEYLELIIAFVQQIPYVENPSPNRKYPVEVIYDKAGDSDEKSLLLANLLAREDYDVSLMVFEELGYETTGIRVRDEIPDASLKVFTDGKKDYVFVDAGIPRFIGSIPEVFLTTEEPEIYPVGSGTKSYGMINYVWKVVADLTHMAKLGKIDRHTVINPWDRTGTCSWIKNSKFLQNSVCYCCDM